MRRIVGKFLSRSRTRSHRRAIEWALELNRRGEVRPDGLKLTATKNRLEIQWRARDVHPWDRALAPEQKARLFVEQCLHDTETALSRLFAALPQIDVIDVAVLDFESDAVILAGTVDRSALARDRQPLSVKMRLRELGVTYRLEGSHFEPLNHNDAEETLSLTR